MMWHTVKRLTLGLTLILAASGVLLLSEAPQRRGRGEKKRIAIVQHSSTSVLDAAVDGMIAGLAERGWVAPDTIELRRFNAEGDITTANNIAQEIVNGGYDLVL